MLLKEYATPENIIIAIILIVLGYLAYKKYYKNNNSYEHVGNTNSSLLVEINLKDKLKELVDVCNGPEDNTKNITFPEVKILGKKFKPKYYSNINNVNMSNGGGSETGELDLTLDMGPFQIKSINDQWIEQKSNLFNVKYIFSKENNIYSLIRIYSYPEQNNKPLITERKTDITSQVTAIMKTIDSNCKAVVINGNIIRFYISNPGSDERDLNTVLKMSSRTILNKFMIRECPVVSCPACPSVDIPYANKIYQNSHEIIQNSPDATEINQNLGYGTKTKTIEVNGELLTPANKKLK